MDVSKLLLLLPEWISIPIIVLSILVTLWPKIISLVQALGATSRVYTREKQRLELLKLNYEIEAIKKINELPDIDIEESLPKDEQVSFKSEIAKENIQTVQLSFWGRFWYGAAGSLFPYLLSFLFNLLNFLKQDMRFFQLTGQFVVINVLVLLTFILIAGIGSAFLAKRNATKPVCFLIGLSISLSISMLLSIAGQSQTMIDNVS